MDKMGRRQGATEKCQKAAKECHNSSKNGTKVGQKWRGQWGNFQFSIVYFQLFSYRQTCLISGLSLSFYSAKCGGVNEGQIGVLAVVSLFISIGYKRFSMAGHPAFILSPCLTSGYGISW
jgi:cellulose synthase/poly-beta-1,6-N-acetylglucosamine synthase-like glycosyltransferase